MYGYPAELSIIFFCYLRDCIKISLVFRFSLSFKSKTNTYYSVGIYSSLFVFSSILSYVFLGLGNYYDHFLIFYTKIKNTILYIFFYKILLEFFLFSKYTKH
uniref:Uncharacterized protein n=1 Tax=Cacopsylla melanoneura TaxID=428564 RepID=A0A8D8WN42_9HEMI